ncbi:MAG: hypothetical protein CMM23_21645 [Rhodospirillaceae bacterium]|jgi:hypothetical protein|nr:hypothetical protein [Rhodospirillaceae bacterium]|tara:strand:- start:19060 stop:19305 length:246 start_codon:yes stop_codon:yes gene_type:complete
MTQSIAAVQTHDLGIRQKYQGYLILVRAPAAIWRQNFCISTLYVKVWQDGRKVIWDLVLLRQDLVEQLGELAIALMTSSMI